jgi:hypothetical protein
VCCILLSSLLLLFYHDIIIVLSRTACSIIGVFFCFSGFYYWLFNFTSLSTEHFIYFEYLDRWDMFCPASAAGHVPRNIYLPQFINATSYICFDAVSLLGFVLYFTFNQSSCWFIFWYFCFERIPFFFVRLRSHTSVVRRHPTCNHPFKTKFKSITQIGEMCDV